jgi:toluene monooxygenase electron transfer component
MAKIEIENASSFECDPKDTILRAALRSGLGFPYECNVGSCGNCRFELLSGEVDHRRADPPAWSERDLKRNRWLGCQAVPRGDCRIKVRLDDTCISAHRPVRRSITLTQVVPLTHDMSEFRFRTGGAARFLPGQYALFEVPGVEGQRAYSYCNTDGETGAWSFQIKRVPGGAATGALFDSLKSGATIKADGPYGLAYLREDAPRDLLLVAGGSGLSPMISIARAAASAERLKDRQIRFFYGGRGARDICGEALLSELAGFGDRITYDCAVSVPDPTWSGLTGFVHDVVREAHGDRLADFEIYFAGPPAMGEAMQRMLFEAKVPTDQVHFDQFY